MTSTDSVLAPPQYWVCLCLAVELSIALAGRRPAALSFSHVHVKELAQVMTYTCQEAKVLPAWTIPCALERVHSSIGSVLHHECALEFLQHLQGDFEGVPQQTIALAVMMIGACRQVTDQVAQSLNYRGTEFAALGFQREPIEDFFDQILDRRLSFRGQLCCPRNCPQTLPPSAWGERKGRV